MGWTSRVKPAIVLEGVLVFELVFSQQHCLRLRGIRFLSSTPFHVRLAMLALPILHFSSDNHVGFAVT